LHHGATEREAPRRTDAFLSIGVGAATLDCKRKCPGSTSSRGFESAITTKGGDATDISIIGVPAVPPETKKAPGACATPGAAGAIVRLLGTMARADYS
jgi:hypothetical protein